MVGTRILSIFFFLVAIGLAILLVLKIKEKIDADAHIAKQESMVKTKLHMIRDAEVAYLAVNGKYTGSFDTLISFVDTGSIYLTQKSEEIIMKEYGGEDVIVTIDTLGKVSVKDSIFVIREPITSLAAGTVQDLLPEGTAVKKGDLIATIISEKGKPIQQKAPYNAKIEKVYSNEGAQVEKDVNLVLLAYDRISDIKMLSKIPGIEEDKNFELFAGKIKTNNVVVDVFEAKDVLPQNPERRKNNNENALRVGSRTEVSVSGNWGGE